MKQFGLSKQERIKSKKELEEVFTSGKRIYSSGGRFKILYSLIDKIDKGGLKVAFAVNRRSGKAVWRNRVKRLMRESFRQNKRIILDKIDLKDRLLLVVFSANRINEKDNSKIKLAEVMPDFIEMMERLEN